GCDLVQNAKSVSVIAANHGNVDVTVTCPPGKSILTGGASITLDKDFDADLATYLQTSDPVDATTWEARAYWDNHGDRGPSEPTTGTSAAKVACAFVSP